MLALVIALSLSSCRGQVAPAVELTPEERSWLSAHGALRFAPDPAFPPIEWFDEEGRYRGLVADHFRLIEERLGVPIEIVRLGTWEEVLRKARAREIDGITAAQVTPERATYLVWTPPILDVPNVVVVRRETGGELTLEALAGKSVAITEGNAIHEFILARQPDVHVVPLPDDLECLTAVSFGRVDATVVNLAIASYLIERHGIANLRVAGDLRRSYPLAIATRNDQPILRSIMSKGLAALTPGERKVIRDRWIQLDAHDAVPWRTAILALLAGLTLLGLVVMLGFGWTRALRRKVVAATADLENQLAERRRTEAALRRSERKLALHLEQAMVGVIEFDLDFRVAFWNSAAERIFGWSRTEAVGRLAAELIIPAAVQPKLQTVWHSLLAQKGGRHSVNENVTRDGRTITCEWFNTTLRDDDGAVSGVMSLAIDVTDRERREEAQARAQRLESLAVLAGGIAHDFNNLLTGILANVSLVLADDPSPPERTEFLREAEAAARRAQGLTRQLLTFARGGAPRKSVVDVGPILREAAQFVTHGSASTFRCEVPEGIWPVRADPGQVGQVVQNLILNAIEAMNGAGTVELSIANERLDSPRGPLKAGDYVRVRVADHGAGIPPSALQRIFDPFFSTKQRGSGLGLAVTHSIVSRHGGHVDVRSSPGEGTVFDVYLPALPGAVPEAAPEGASPRQVHARVLVMDDEETIRQVAPRVLEGMGCEVEVAADGVEAVARWQEAREAGRAFDLVIVDLTVPGGMGGLETLAAMRRIDPSVKAVVSSGYSNSPVMADPAASGFAGVISKPWSAADVRRVVADLVAASS